jgi:hypothetical protein
MNSAGHCGRSQWSLVSTTAVGSCQAGIQPTLAILRTQLPVLANTARSRVYRRHPSAHQRNWQPPMQRPSPLSLRPVPSRLSRPGHSIRPANLSADRTRPANLTALGQCAQPEEDTGSLADSSVADTEYSQASTLLACLLLASQAGTLSSRCRRHPRRSVHIASASWPSRFWSTPTHSSTLATSLPHG